MEYGGRRRLLPEYEACRRMAEAQGLPLIEVYRLVPRQVTGGGYQARMGMLLFTS